LTAAAAARSVKPSGPDKCGVEPCSEIGGAEQQDWTPGRLYPIDAGQNANDHWRPPVSIAFSHGCLSGRLSSSSMKPIALIMREKFVKEAVCSLHDAVEIAIC
jgi:hypothetical protein